MSYYERPLRSVARLVVCSFKLGGERVGGASHGLHARELTSADEVTSHNHTSADEVTSDHIPSHFLTQPPRNRPGRYPGRIPPLHR